MQQRASIVRALSPDPKVLLMDEPFGALDAFTRDEMNVMLLEIWERSRKTIVFVTHSIPEAVYLSDRVYVMTPRPGRNSKVYDIPLGRPRPLALTTERAFFDIVGEIKQQIYSTMSTRRRKKVPTRSITSQESREADQSEIASAIRREQHVR